MEFYNSDLFLYVVLPILIFVARIFDVTFGTLRIVFIARGKKNIAPILGFFEVFVWIVAIGKIMENSNNFMCYFAYASGFAMGNYIGMLIEEKLAIGIEVVRIITSKDATALKEALINSGYGITSIDAKGAKGKVDVIFTTIQRADINNVVSLITKYQPNAFYSVEDIKFVKQGVFPINHHFVSKKHLSSIFRWRVGK